MKDIGDGRNNFVFKLSAAKYHYKMINLIFRKNKQQVITNIDLPNTRPLIYHYYAFTYELYSCFDMTLHYINDNYNLGFSGKSINWRPVTKPSDKNNFQAALEKRFPKIYSTINEVYNSEWFAALKATREYIAHHGIIGIMLEYNNDKIKGINPEINGKVFHFDCNLWGEEMSKFFNSIYSRPTV